MNVTSNWSATKDKKDAMKVCKASVLTGKSHALELLGESLDTNCANPIKAIDIRASGDQAPQQWETKHTTGNVLPPLMHIARLPGNPPLTWYNPITANGPTARDYANNKVQPMATITSIAPPAGKKPYCREPTPATPEPNLRRHA
jgi:hypothetical protein